MAERSADSLPHRWLWAAGYLVVFFAATAIGGLLFLAGGVGLILVPGSLPVWAEAGYIMLGVVGSVGIGLLATNGAFRRHRAQAPSPPATRQARFVRWLASLSGALLVAVAAAVARYVVTRLLEG